MNLIALLCTKCGSPLDFKNSLINVCESCQTPHALIRQKGDFDLPFSFIPYIQNKNGEMEIPLKIQLARKIKKETNRKYFVEDDGFADNYVIVTKNGEVDYPDCLISEYDNVPLAVGIPGIVEKEDFGFFISYKKKELGIVEICEIYVRPVKVKQNGTKILVGHRFYIEVSDPEYKDEVAKLTKLIQKWFNTIPEVRLVRG